MAKYVVKNERGEYLCQRSGPSYWDANRDDRWSTRNRAVAFERAKRALGRVYRVRSVSARRERDAILALIMRLIESECYGTDRACALQMAFGKVERLEHRRRHAKR